MCVNLGQKAKSQQDPREGNQGREGEADVSGNLASGWRSGGMSWWFRPHLSLRCSSGVQHAPICSQAGRFGLSLRCGVGSGGSGQEKGTGCPEKPHAKCHCSIPSAVSLKNQQHPLQGNCSCPSPDPERLPPFEADMLGSLHLNFVSLQLCYLEASTNIKDFVFPFSLKTPNRSPGILTCFSMTHRVTYLCSTSTQCGGSQNEPWLLTLIQPDASFSAPAWAVES